MNENASRPLGREINNKKERMRGPVALFSDLGNYALHRAILLINPDLRSEPTELEKLVMSENEVIYNRQNGHNSNIFRTKPLEGTNHEARYALMEQFLTELETCETISERYDLFMDKRYADDIYTLDLGETVEAGSHEAVEALKSEYHTLLERVKSAGDIEDEFPRRESSRTIHFRESQDSRFLIGERNRTLFCFKQDGRKITVSKRMTFLIEKAALPTPVDLHKPNGKMHLGLIQKLIDTNSDSIVPVRTVYFATNKEIKS